MILFPNVITNENNTEYDDIYNMMMLFHDFKVNKSSGKLILFLIR